jgi:hypothetical protein
VLLNKWRLMTFLKRMQSGLDSGSNNIICVRFLI